MSLFYLFRVEEERGICVGVSCLSAFMIPLTWFGDNKVLERDYPMWPQCGEGFIPLSLLSFSHTHSIFFFLSVTFSLRNDYVIWLRIYKHTCLLTLYQNPTMTEQRLLYIFFILLIIMYYIKSFIFAFIIWMTLIILYLFYMETICLTKLSN